MKESSAKIDFEYFELALCSLNFGLFYFISTKEDFSYDIYKRIKKRRSRKKERKKTIQTGDYDSHLRFDCRVS